MECRYCFAVDFVALTYRVLSNPICVISPYYEVLITNYFILVVASMAINQPGYASVHIVA